MSNPSKRKGTRAETKVARYLTSHGLRAERRALSGSNDQGDLRVYAKDGTEVTIEVKSGEQTNHPTRTKMEIWKDQTLAEATNSGCPSALVIVQYHRQLVDALVYLPVRQWGTWVPRCGTDHEYWARMRLDEFMRELGGE
jgi:Holliday junction resolvase